MGQHTEVSPIPPWDRAEQEASDPERHDQDRDGAEPAGADELDFFISYTSADLDVARRIADELRRAGRTVRFQQADFGVGGKFQRQIDDALARAQKVIAVVSEASLASQWCRDEWDAAGDKLIPVRIEQVDVSGLRGLLTWVDLFGPGMDDDDRFREVLLEAVAGHQPAGGPRRELEATIDLPRRRPVLIGRKALLADIYAHLQRQGTAPRRLTLTGMGGVGKTAVAIEYGHRMLEHSECEHVWFVRADQPAALEDHFRLLVSEFQVARKDVPLAEQVSRVIERQDDRWLLIIDRAPDLRSIADYLPRSGRGQILLTSENTATWGAANTIEVGGWPRDEAVAFLLDQTGSSDRAAAEALIEELDYHPESIIHAASFMDLTAVPIASYLARYRDRRDEAAERELAWMAVALDDLKSKPLAIEALRVAAYLAPDEIPLDLLVRGLAAAGHPIGEHDFDVEVAEPLRRFSLIRRDDRLITVSRLVQRHLQASADRRGDAKTWIAAALESVDASFPSTAEMSQPEEWRRGTQLLPHLLTVTEHARGARVDLARVGSLWSRAGAYLATAEFDVGDAARSATDPHSPGATAPMSDGGTAVSALNLLTNARGLLEEVLGVGHIEVAEPLAELGELWRQRGRLDVAIPYFQEAYEVTVTAAGEDSRLSGLRLIHLARAERDAGAASAAAEKLHRALTLAEKLGPDGLLLRHEALASLGIARTRQGRHAEAVANLRESIKIEEQLWGPHHIEVAMTLDALGNALAAYGDPVAAAEAYDRKLEIERALYGEQGRQRSYGLTVAALDAIDAGDVDRARRLALEVLALVGDKPAQYDNTVSLVRQVLARADRIAGGEEWRDGLAAAGRALTEAGLPDIETRLLLVSFLLADGWVGEAAEVAASAVRDAIDGGDGAMIADAAATEASARTALGDLEGARTGLRSLIDSLERNPGADDSLLVRARLDLGHALRSLEQLDEALECHVAAHQAAESLGYVLLQAEAALGMAQTLTLRGEQEESVVVLREALELRAANLATGHSLVVEAQLALARAEGSIGHDAEARRLLNDAVAVTAARSGAQSVDVVWTYIDAAETLIALEETAAAKARLDEALRIVDHIDRDADALAAKTAIGTVLLNTGDLDQAREVAAGVRAAAAGLAGARGRVALAGAADLDLWVAAEAGDADGARRALADLERELGDDPGVLPRLRADCWLRLASVVASRPDEALAAVLRAQALVPYPTVLTREEVALWEAQLRWQAGASDVALELAENLLGRTRDPSTRLGILQVAVFTAMDTEQPERAGGFLDEAADLAEREDDPLVRAGGFIWIASAQTELGNEPESRRLHRLAAEDLRTVLDEGQPDAVRAATELYGELAHELTRVGEFDEAAHAVEDALDGFRSAFAGSDDGGTSESGFLLALMGASKLTDKGAVGADAYSGSRLDDADAWQQVLTTLVDLIGDLAFEDESFDRLTRWAQGLGEKGAAASLQVAFLATLAERRASMYWWDERAGDVLAMAENQLSSLDEPLESLNARLALLRTDAYLEAGEPREAIGVLDRAAEVLREGSDPTAAAQVLMRLASLHAGVDEPQAAAIRFEQAKRLLDDLRSPLGERLELRTTLALSHLRAGNRPAGIGELRRAASLILDEDAPADAETVQAMVRLVAVLVTEADDSQRASAVLRAALDVHGRMLESSTPRLDSLPQLAAAVRHLQGLDAALALVMSTAEKLGEPSSTWEALIELVDTDATFEEVRNAVGTVGDPVVRVGVACMIARVLSNGGRDEDARTLLDGEIDRVRRENADTPSLELDLLIESSELESEDRARTALERARQLASADDDLQPMLEDIEERISILDAPVPTPDSVDTLSRLVAQYPDDPGLLADLAFAEFDADRHQASLDSAGQLLAITGREPWALVLCANLCNRLAEFEAAAEYARAAIDVDPSDASAHSSLAWALQHLGTSRGEECEAAFERVLAAAQDRSARMYALKGRAGARRALGREDEARADYEEVLHSLQPDEDPWLEGWVRYNLGDFDAATTALRRALDEDDSRIAARFDLALVSAVAGRPAAIEEYRQAIASLVARRPRSRLAPLRIAQNDLRDAETAHSRLKSDPAFRTIVDEVDSAVEATEALVVRPILPEIPPDAA